MGMRTICFIALVSLIAGCNNGPAEDADAAPAPTRQQIDWPVYRGDVMMTGRAAGSISDELELVWQHMTEGPIVSSPVVADGVVFIGSGDSHVYALNLSDGSVKWSRQLGSNDDLADIEAPPMVRDGTVYIGSTNKMFYALDAADGSERWTFTAKDQITGSATPAKLRDGRAVVLVGSYDGSLYCLDARDGKPVWTFTTQNYINGAPAVQEELRLVVFGGCDGFVYSIDLDTGEQHAAINIEHPNAGTTALHGRHAYLGHHGNAFVAGNFDTGAIKWTYQNKRRPFPFFSAPAITQHMAVFGGRDRDLHAVDLADGKPLWQFAAGGKIDSSPVIVGDRVIVGCADGLLYIINRNDGSLVWSYEIGRAISGSPAVASGYVLIGSEDGGLYAFKAKQTQGKGAP